MKADVPEERELSQYGMILLFGAKLTLLGGFVLCIEVMESKNSAAASFAFEDSRSIRESTGDCEALFGVGDTWNWRLSTS